MGSGRGSGCSGLGAERDPAERHDASEINARTALVALSALAAWFAELAFSALTACVALGTVPSVEDSIWAPVKDPGATSRR
jgi:hypothetical protein